MALPVRKAYKGAPVTTTLSALLSAGSTSCTVAAVTGWPTTFPFYIVIEPGTSREEKVRVTAATGTTLTIVRAQDDTSDVEHASASTVYVVFTAVEADEANQIASAMTTKGDLITTNGSSINRLAVGGTNTHVLQVDSAQTNGIKWGQVATAGIEDGAVTSAKIADATIAATDIASAALTLLCPVGTISAYGGTSAPTGWLLCNGSAISGSYTELIALVGANTPNFSGRTLVGRDTGQTEFDTMFETGGAKTVTLSTSEIPSHQHNVTAYSHTVTQSNALGTHDHTFSGTVASAGDHSHTITVTDPGHSHTIDLLSREKASGSTFNMNPVSFTANETQSTRSATTGITASSNTTGAHQHTFSGTTGVSSNLSHGHSVSVADHAAKNTDAAGGGGAHNNLQPYSVITYIIKHDY
jgi:microcystin-dependent protein